MSLGSTLLRIGESPPFLAPYCRPSPLGLGMEPWALYLRHVAIAELQPQVSLFGDRIFLCGPGRPRACNAPASTMQVLGMQENTMYMYS